jgi:ribosomal protein S18 acetylase RimI-like enzyme
VLYPINETVAEIKNISVVEHLQGRGIGAFLLKDAVQKAKFQGFKKLMIATGNSSVGPLNLYQKLGFRIVEIQKDYFIENYPEPIIENGILCSDKLVLEMEV